MAIGVGKTVKEIGIRLLEDLSACEWARQSSSMVAEDSHPDDKQRLITQRIQVQQRDGDSE